ncbi:MAG: glucose-1-phosphate thymidylyltransferase [Candidatus Omnitrophota bacterium]|jgi:glucose-1-phosphate thymidylyltransferase
MSKLIGIILAGGLGTRLLPLTTITNKHLLPVYDQPMIYYPIQSMVQAGIKDIVLVTGGDHAGEFMKLLGDGQDFGLNSLNYVYQKGNGGIAHALGMTRDITRDRPLAVMLGDNIFENSIKQYVDQFIKNPIGAYVALKRVNEPQRFGVASVDGKRITNIVEKPKNPASDLAVTGLYFYDTNVFNIISKLKPSKRGELEITDVNNTYIKNNQMSYGQVKGWWTDCGTVSSLFHASQLIKRQRDK